MTKQNEELDPQDSSVPATQMELFVDAPKAARPEYNIGKNANLIFASPYAKNLYDEFVLPGSRKTEDGGRVDTTLTITPLKDRKRPTTTSLKVFLGLVQLWDMQGKPEDGIINFSTRQFAHVLGFAWQGKHTSDKIAEHLEILSHTKIEFTFLFKKPNGDFDAYSDPIVLIDSGRYVAQRRRQKSDAFRQLHQYRLNQELVQNMLAGHVRPLNYQSFISIKNEMAASLYSMLDLYLAKRTKYERNSLPLLTEDLGLSGVRNNFKHNRHQTLKKLVSELDGKELLNGKLALSIEPSKQTDDWKLVARKIPRIEPKPRSKVKRLAAKTEAAQFAADIVDQIKRQPNHGNPNLGVITYFATYMPQNLLSQALSIAKGDYTPSNTEKTLSAVFVGICKQLAAKHGCKFPEKNR